MPPKNDGVAAAAAEPLTTESVATISDAPAPADLRAGTTDLQNRIDLNDPRKSGSDVVAEHLDQSRSEAKAG